MGTAAHLGRRGVSGAVGLSIALLAASFAVLMSAPAATSSFTPRGTIAIQGNPAFTASRGVVGGSGLPTDPFIIEGWEINASTSHGIWISQTTAYYVIRNVYVHSGGSDWYGVLLNYAPNGRVENSTFVGNKHGVGVINSDYVVVVDNVVDASDVFGVYLAGMDWSNYTTVSRNVISGQSGAGILAGATAYTLISDNVVSSSFYGIWLLIIPNNITISGNRVSGSNQAGIYLEYARDVEVFGNYVTGTTLWGLKLGEAGIKAHHNTLVGNGVNADGTPAPFVAWDNGWPSGGNYWDDYSGVDNCSGPNQDVCTGPDGFGDTPYMIGINNRDRYPLMQEPPDTFPPTASVLTSATLTGPTLGNLRVTWARAADEGTVGGTVTYQVLRSSSWIGGYAVIATTAATGQATYQYFCLGCGHSLVDTSTKFYRIRAVDAAGNTADSDAAAKSARTVPAGRHLLSVPLQQTNWSLSKVLQTVSYDRVRTYRSVDSLDPWKAFHAARAGDLATLEFGEAFWVNVTADGVYTVAGLVETTPSAVLRPGWNLVGYSAWVTETRAQSLAGVPGVVRMETFDSTASPYYLRGVTSGEPLVPGEGYWVLVIGAGGTWVQG